MANKNPRHSYEIKVGACADYLIGRPLKEIQAKWRIPPVTLMKWIKARGCFKIDRKRR